MVAELGGGGISVDQEVVRVLQPPTALSSLELGVRVKQAIPRSRMIYRGSEQPVPPENDPAAVYARLFGSQTTGPMSEMDVTRLLTRRRSILDFVHHDFKALTKSVAQPDRIKLEQHADALRDLERRLGHMTRAGTACQPDEPKHENILGEAEFRQILRTQVDLMVSSLACDLTRVASLQCSSSVNALRFTFMDLNDHEGHSLSHAGDTNDAMQGQWEQCWFGSEQQKYLLDQLAAVPEGNGSLLDNTVVLFVNELSRGNSHSHINMPFMIAGGAGGRLKTGRHLAFHSRTHTDLLVSVLNLMGIDATTFGDPRFCNGPLPGLI